MLEISDPSESNKTSNEEMDSVALYHCDDQELFKNLQVLQFLPPCEVGAELYFDVEDNAYFDNYYNDWSDIESIDKCLKTQLRLFRNYRPELSRNQKKASKSSSCKDRLEENEKLKFQFKWVYFKGLTQYLIPFGALVGTLILASITGTIWDCFHKKKAYKCETKRGNRVGNI